MKHRFVVTRLQIFSLSIWPFIERNSAKHRYKQSLLQREPEGKVIPAAIYHLELPLVKVCSEDQEYRLEFVRYAESQHHPPPNRLLLQASKSESDSDLRRFLCT